jgi:Ca-activated chloride channel family protein
MRTLKLMQSLSWTAASAVVTLMIVACAQVLETPNQTATRGSADRETVVVTAQRNDAASADVERNEVAEQQRSQERLLNSAPIVQPAAPPSENTIVVAGSRIERDDFSSADAGAGYQAQRSLRSRDVLNFYAGNGRGVSGQIADAPLSRVQPGEEVWVIGRDAVAAATGDTVADDALGSGVMLARYTPAVLDDAVTEAPQPVREIPLPLKHTDVDAVIQGYVGTVDVTQEFENPYDSKIEAVYMFPLPEKSAVSEFVMTIGERRIRGILREKEQAQAIYNQARAQGYQASLLVQHRPNVFEQKVANIEPGKQIDVNIRYFQTLAYADGWYSFVFPTVVGPRYNPPGSKDPLLALPQNDFSPNPDAAVRYLRPGTTSKHDISISVELDAGVAIEEIASSHELATVFGDDDTVSVELADGAAVPNRDFLLRFRVAGDRIKSNLLTYVDEDSGEGYFTLMMYPPANLEKLRRQPLELVFVLDTSGSMSGAPIEQAKDAIIAALDRLEPDDTFQIIRFSQSTSRFGRRPLAATRENIAEARRYVRRLSGSGGTEMIEGIRAALNFPHDDQRLRFVTFLTDGFIGNETEILDEIDFSLDASRIFSFGVGSAPNRYLLERMAGIGRGAVAWLSLEDSGREVMDAFFDRIAHPAMIDVNIDWERMNVADVFPRRMPDLFVGRPVILTGKFSGEPGDIRMNGRAANEPVSVRLNHEGDTPEHEFLPNLWARLKIADLNDALAVNPQRLSSLSREIRQTALAYNLMSDYTSFIAVDASEITGGGYGTTVFQGVPVPEGVRYDTAVAR